MTSLLCYKDTLLLASANYLSKSYTELQKQQVRDLVLSDFHTGCDTKYLEITDVMPSIYLLDIPLKEGVKKSNKILPLLQQIPYLAIQSKQNKNATCFWL